MNHLGIELEKESKVGVPEDLAGLDTATALARVGGDEELLKEIAGIFLEQCPEALNDVRSAVSSGDADGLQHSAHSLKGSISNFGAKEAYDAAYRLEMMGRDANFGGSAEALAELERSLAALEPQLLKLSAP